MDKCNRLKDFSKKYDVDIIFKACLKSNSRVGNSINIIFENPSKNKFLGIFGSKTDKIEIERDTDLANTAESFEQCTRELIRDIDSHHDGWSSGRLDHFIDEKAKEIDKNTVNINV